MVRRHLRAQVSGMFLAVTLLVPTAPAIAVDNGGLVDNVRSVLSDESRQALPIENYRLDLICYYTADDAQPLFVGTNRPRGLTTWMLDSQYDGLDPQ